MDFRNRRVVVTGGTGALGTAVVGALLEAGAICHVPYMAEPDVQNFAHRAHKNVVLVETGDLADEKAVARLFAAVPDLWASIHLAGGFAFGPLAEASVAEIRGQAEMNLITCLLCCRAAVRKMLETATGGRIVNVAARPAIEWRVGASMVAYAAAKAGVAALTTALAEEVVKQGILVNAVAPSILDTPANRASMPKANHAAWVKVEDAARVIVFLASPENRATRGAVLPVYAGA